MLTLDTVAKFTWGFGHEFFLETEFGNYIWSDPSYGGNNTIRATHLSYRGWAEPFWGREKGKHVIREYCGESVEIVP